MLEVILKQWNWKKQKKSSINAGKFTIVKPEKEIF